MAFDLADSQLSQNTERTTTFVGQRRIRDTEGFFLLTSFVRTTTEKADREVPGFSKIPMAGKSFRKSIADVANRSVILQARPVLVQREPLLLKL